MTFENVYSGRSGYMSVRSARGGECLSPVSSLLVETRQVLHALPEAQSAALLMALLRGCAPVALEAQSRITKALKALNFSGLFFVFLGFRCYSVC